MPYSLLSKFIKITSAQPTTAPEQTGEESREVVSPPQDQWSLSGDNEGTLAIDMYRTKDAIIVKSTIAAVSDEDLNIDITNDLLTIRGQRQRNEVVAQENYYYQECYWGGFSRTMVLPMEVISDGVEATLHNGLLTVRLPLAQKSRSIKVTVRRE